MHVILVRLQNLPNYSGFIIISVYCATRQKLSLSHACDMLFNAVNALQVTQFNLKYY